jgi:ABC-type transport system, involved in lipoprotein release, permease component
MKFLALVASNLKRKKARTLLTLLSIVVAFFLFGLLSALRQSLAAGIEVAGADRLITRHKVSIIQMIPIAYRARVEAIPGIDATVPLTWFGGIYQDPKNFFASFPVDHEAFLDMFPEFALSEEQKQSWRGTRNGAVVGRTTAERFGWKIGDRIPLSSPIWRRDDGSDGWEFQLVGIYDAGKKGVDTSQFFFRYDYFDEGRFEQSRGLISYFTIRVADPAQADDIAARVDREFANSPIETKTEPEGAFAAGFAQQVGDIGLIVTGILGAVFFTILLVSGNTIAQSVRERTEEIGVLKALGFPNGLVLALVLAESTLIAALGGLTGLALAWLVTAGGSPMPSMLPVFYFPIPDLLLGLALVFILGLVTGALPALQAMRLHVAEALRRNA